MGSDYRICETPDLERISYWLEQGFQLVDRLLEIKVPLKKNTVDFAKKIRFEIEYTGNYREELYEIAKESFEYDTRFCVTIPVDEQTRRKRIYDYIQKYDKWFVCKYKEEVIGFIIPEIRSESEVVVYLAAVRAEYRISGASVSLYNYVAQYYKKQGYNALLGEISSRNIDVANLYLSLGGKFVGAKDVYLKIINKEQMEMEQEACQKR